MRTIGRFFRVIIAIAAIGMVASALVLLGEAALNLVAAVQLLANHAEAGSAVSLIMKVIDECLFGIILVLLSAKVVLSFVLREVQPGTLPKWMHPSDMTELKSTFCQAVVVFLIVDFATDMASAEGQADWNYLVIPLSIVLIAGALKLMSHPANHG